MAKANLLFSGASFKASHNSYSFKPPVVRQLAWDSRKRYRAGCRGLELDVVQRKGGWDWSVQHGGGYVSDKAVQLQAYLGGLAEWSADMQGKHEVVTVHIDLKNSEGADSAFPAEFDSYLAKAMAGADVFTPGELLGSQTTLLSAAQDHGWPPIDELRGKFLFCLTGHQMSRTEKYTSGSQAQRLCFCDWDVNVAIDRPIPDPGQPNRLFYNFYPLPYNAEWVDALLTIAGREAFVIRAYEVNDHTRWRLALKAGVNVLATDQVFYTPWASVGGSTIVPIKKVKKS